MRIQAAVFYPAYSDNMWEISIGGQLITGLYSLALGAVLCAFYDIFRAFRKAGADSFISVFIGDIVFWLVSAVAVFLFLIAVTNGEIRGYVILFCIAGFLLYRITIGKAVFFLLCKLLFFGAGIRRGISKILAGFSSLIVKITGFFLCKTAKIAQVVSHTAKKLLKSVYNMLYTKRQSDKLENDVNE